MAHAIRSAAPAPSPVDPGAGRATYGEHAETGRLPSDPGRATEQLYRLHGGTVLRYAWHLLGRREDAEDATQATFLAVHGALARGTAVLQPGAWVLSIARNECMGRLRQTARGPAVDLLDGDSEIAAAGGVEQTAELHDEMRTARHALGLLPRPERDAFLLREWLGLPTGEVAVAIGVTALEVETLAVRARRSLMLAVGGLEPAAGCAGTRAALEAGTLGRAGKVHLLRCPVCRGVRRALRGPDASKRSLLPDAGVAGRLAAVLPGFGMGGGGVLAALTAKTAAAPLVTKAAWVVAAALMTGGVVGETIRSSLPAHHRAHGGQARALPVAAVAVRHSSRASVALVATRRTHAPVATRGGLALVSGHAASRGGRSAGSRHGDGQGSSGHGDGGRATSGDGERADGGATAGGHDSHSDSGKVRATPRRAATAAIRAAAPATEAATPARAIRSSSSRRPCR